MASEGSRSPNGDEATTHTTGATARPEVSLKRGRAESVEPSHPAEPPTPTTAVKKNRTAPSTGQSPSKPLDPDPSPNVEKPETEPIAEEEEPEVENVGEVRRKVEKMSYKEGTLDEPLPSDIAKVVEKGDEKDEQDGEQEEKATEAKEDEGGLKRKALDRSQSSYIESEAEPKRPKDEPTPEPKKQTTFSSFSSTSSPFASASTTNAFAKSGFGNYSSTSSPFAKAKPKESEPTEAAGPSALAEISEQEKAKEEKEKMTAQNVSTGEESEDTIYQTRTKLYVMEPDGGWRERGVGMFKLNVRKVDGKGARLVMRAEGVLRLILNVSLYVGQSCLEDGKHIRMTVFEDGERKLITFRTGSTKVASEMYQAIHEHIPVESSVPPSSPPDLEAGK